MMTHTVVGCIVKCCGNEEERHWRRDENDGKSLIIMSDLKGMKNAIAEIYPQRL